MFSIIIPLYNKEDSIEETLQSVFAQSFSTFEVIIINDGSSDNSLEIAEKATDPRARIYSKENGGVSDARNYGIANAQYDFIAFLDADDSWEICYLEKMLELINKYPGCGMYNSAYRMNINNKNFEIDFGTPPGVVKDYFKKSINNAISWTSATIVNKFVFDKAGYFPVGMIGGEDVYMWTKIAIYFPVAFTPEKLATYNRENKTLISRDGKKDTCEESWYDLYCPTKPDLNNFIAVKAILKGIRYIWGGHKAESLKIEKQFEYVKKNREFQHQWYKLFILNRLPSFVRKVLFLYRKTTLR